MKIAILDDYLDVALGLTHWKQLGSDLSCCSYYGILEAIDEKGKNKILNKLKKLENFYKWKF